MNQIKVQKGKSFNSDKTVFHLNEYNRIPKL